MAVLIDNMELILCSFGASFGLGIVFRIQKEDLLPAGLGGALTRCVYLILLEMTDMIFLQSLIAAVIAALYAELMAMHKKTPSTVFLYPAILPLIPGSTLYYIAVNLILGNRAETLSCVWDCALALGGICIGFVLISTFTYYRRLYYLGEHIEGRLRAALKKSPKTRQ